MNNKMKTLRAVMLLAVVAFSATTFQSCDPDDDCDYWEARTELATVTIKKSNNATDSWYMQLDDNVTLFPNNAKSFDLPDEETRAYIRYTFDTTPPDPAANTLKDSYRINLLTVDPYLTKPMAPLVNEPEKEYGNDPVEIVDSWETVAEDGYLNIRFRTYFSPNSTHTVNLVHRTDANTPYLVDFYHDANGDTNGRVADDVVAFRLDDAFNASDEPIEIILRWNSYSGVKTHTFKYNPRKD